MRKLLFVPPTFSAFHYMFHICLHDNNSKTIKDIKFKFSALHSFMEATKCMKFQSDRCKDFKVGILRISPISVVLNHKKSGETLPLNCEAIKSLAVDCNWGLIMR